MTWRAWLVRAPTKSQTKLDKAGGVWYSYGSGGRWATRAIAVTEDVNMDNGKYGNHPIDERKALRVTVRSEVIRLAKSKAASQEITLWFVIERLLVQWVKGDITLNMRGSDGQ